MSEWNETPHPRRVLLDSLEDLVASKVVALVAWSLCPTWGHGWPTSKRIQI